MRPLPHMESQELAMPLVALTLTPVGVDEQMFGSRGPSASCIAALNEHVDAVGNDFAGAIGGRVGRLLVVDRGARKSADGDEVSEGVWGAGDRGRAWMNTARIILEIGRGLVSVAHAADAIVSCAASSGSIALIADGVTMNLTGCPVSFIVALIRAWWTRSGKAFARRSAEAAGRVFHAAVAGVKRVGKRLGRMWSLLTCFAR